MDRVAETALRSQRRSQDIVVVAVTKTASPDQIRTLVDMGHIDLGESRVQQLSQRGAQLGEYLSRKRTLGRIVEEAEQPNCRWHMIGHLQRNKVQQVVPLVKLIHSIDSLRLVEEVQSVAARADTTVEVLLQINASGEPTKQGVAAPAVLHLAEQIDTMLNLRLRGLMTMAPRVENPEEVRSIFARTNEIFHEMKSEGIGRDHCNVLSMGMTNDFEVAIEEGANVVRIGRAIFGEG